jgi:hypothetical protein
VVERLIEQGITDEEFIGWLVSSGRDREAAGKWQTYDQIMQGQPSIFDALANDPRTFRRLVTIHGKFNNPPAPTTPAQEGGAA